jgi:hypothetical protein
MNVITMESTYCSGSWVVLFGFSLLGKNISFSFVTSNNSWFQIHHVKGFSNLGRLVVGLDLGNLVFLVCPIWLPIFS